MDWRTRAPLIALLGVLVGVTVARAEELPDQMIYGGLEPDPIGDPGSGPARFEAQWLELPDGRTAQDYRISVWTKIGTAHAAQVALNYVGLEGKDSFRYGGGRASVRWTTRLGLGRRLALALDAGGDVPLGDPTLFPLSARAPMGIVRTRVGLVRAGFVRLWAGWWARRASPPSDRNRQDPLGGFAAGSGYDAMMQWRLHPVDVDWMLHLPTGGDLDRVFHWTVRADWWVADDLALRIGAGLDTGPAQDRSFDLQVLLGATWRRPREQPEG